MYSRVSFGNGLLHEKKKKKKKKTLIKAFNSNVPISFEETGPIGSLLS